MTNPAILSHDFRHFEGLINSAVENWAPGANLRIIKQLTGVSGAAVLKVDISGDPIPPGQYILKLYNVPEWEPKAPEGERHKLACSRDAEFAEQHIPHLRQHFRQAGQDDTDPDRVALLYEIAGYSLDNFRMIDSPDSVSGTIARTCERLFRDLLERWSDDMPSEPVTPRSILQEWLSYRLHPEKGKALYELVKAEFEGAQEVVRAHESIINPLWLCTESKALDESPDVTLRGLLHGDMHPGNVLTHRAPSEHCPYWIIDFAMARVAPIGYDHAYFEVAYILALLADAGPEQLIGLLKALEVPPGREELPPQNVGLAQTVRTIRQCLSDWQRTAQPRRFDPLTRQFGLARVAAGLNWANKAKLPLAKRRLALYYSAWCARRYLEEHHPSAWRAIAASAVTLPDGVGLPAQAVQVGALWGEFWERVGHFDSTSQKYVLVVEAIGDKPGIESLGLLPWSVIIDLDHESDGNGLYKKAGPILEARRSVTAFAMNPTPTDFERGTLWMMACGWIRKSINQPGYDAWRRTFLPQIRELCVQMRKATSPDPVRVVVLLSKSDQTPNKSERLERLINEIDEAFLGDVQIIVLGDEQHIKTSLATCFPLSLDAFVDRIHSIYGSGSKIELPQIPGQDGIWRTLPLDALRDMEQSLDVLHSRILEDTDPRRVRPQEAAFWRGHLPTWADLNAEVDIRRDIHDALLEEVRARLGESRNYTIELYHTPGAGGTTTAYRAAWDLRTEFPTAILRRYSPATSGHLRTFCQMAQRSVLLIADASILTDSPREKLYLDMVGWNCRVVLLLVRRELTGKKRYKLQLDDPMGDSEAARFYTDYSKLTSDQHRKQELERITTWPQLKRYRCAFFYGLVTFERDFQKIEGYVKTHLLNVRRRIRNVIEYLALITRFSGSAIHEVLLRRLMNVSDDTKLGIPELLGEGPDRLILRTGAGLKLMHPLVAEEVLAALRGGDVNSWRLDLADLSLDFLKDVADAVPTDSDEIRDLFRRLFITRESRTEGAVGMRDIQHFSELIEEIDSVDKLMGQRVLEKLTEVCPSESHFWNHRGRHHVYRMNREHKQAQEFLEEAIRLAPGDPIHHHTLGLVQRSWIAHRILNELRGAPPDQILQEIGVLYSSAAYAFATARKLNPSDEYGYITHIQMVIWIGRRLKDAGKTENIAELAERFPEVGKWLTENVGLAESLLDAAERLYNSLLGSRFVLKCVAGFKHLYGDLDNVIRTWELILSRGLGEPADRRALAHAYLARRKRSLASMKKGEARRIVQLMEENLARSAGDEEDFRLWFEACKRLDDFDIDHALHRLRLWGERFGSGRAYYYMYTLQFLLWLKGEVNDTSALDESLKECERLALGRRTRSFEWLAVAPSFCPLVSEDELGGWNGNLRFWNSSGPLRRVNGIIEHMSGQRAGNVIIDGKVRAFFVPGPRFWKINQEINFYIGFSFEGLRAWQPEPGWVEDGSRGGVAVPVRLVAEGVARTGTPAQVANVQQITDAIRESLKQRVADFLFDLSAARSAVGSPMLLNDVEARLLAVFGRDDLFDVLGFKNVRELLNSLDAGVVDDPGSAEATGGMETDILPVGAPDTEAYNGFAAGRQDQKARGQICHFDRERKFGYVDDGSGKDAFFIIGWVDYEDRHLIRKGTVVEFVPKENERGPVATLIHVVKAEKSQFELDVRQYILEILKNGKAWQKAFPLVDLEQELQRSFPDHPRIHRFFGFSTLQGFVKSIPGTFIEGSGPMAGVRLAPTPRG